VWLMAQWLCESMEARGDVTAVAGPWGTSSYAQLVEQTHGLQKGLLASVEPGAVVAFDGDYGPGAIALLLALALNRNVVVPLSRDVAAPHDKFTALAEAEYRIRDVETAPRLEPTGVHASHPLYAEL